MASELERIIRELREENLRLKRVIRAMIEAGAQLPPWASDINLDVPPPRAESWAERSERMAGIRTLVYKEVVRLFRATGEPVTPRQVYEAFRRRHPDLLRQLKDLGIETISRRLRELADPKLYDGHPPLMRVGKGEYIPVTRFDDVDGPKDLTRWMRRGD